MSDTVTVEEHLATRPQGMTEDYARMLVGAGYCVHGAHEAHDYANRDHTGNEHCPGWHAITGKDRI